MVQIAGWIPVPFFDRTSFFASFCTLYVDSIFCETWCSSSSLVEPSWLNNVGRRDVRSLCFHPGLSRTQAEGGMWRNCCTVVNLSPPSPVLVGSELMERDFARQIVTNIFFFFFFKFLRVNLPLSVKALEKP